jgi:hypothetical protein
VPWAERGTQQRAPLAAAGRQYEGHLAIRIKKLSLREMSSGLAPVYRSGNLLSMRRTTLTNEVSSLEQAPPLLPFPVLTKSGHERVTD